MHPHRRLSPSLFGLDAQTPNLLRQLVWDSTPDDAAPLNAAERTLLQLVDKRSCVASAAHIPTFVEFVLAAATVSALPPEADG